MKKFLVLLILALLPMVAQAQNIVYNIPVTKEISASIYECEGAVLLMDDTSVMVIIQYSDGLVSRKTFRVQSINTYSTGINLSDGIEGLDNHYLTIETDGSIRYQYFDPEDELFDDDIYLEGDPEKIIPVCKKLVADGRSLTGPFFSHFTKK